MGHLFSFLRPAYMYSPYGSSLLIYLLGEMMVSYYMLFCVIQTYLISLL